MVRLLIVLALLCSTPAVADLNNPGVTVDEGGARIGFCHTLDYTEEDFDVTKAGGVCTVAGRGGYVWMSAYAACDGVTDDTTAVTNALTAAAGRVLRIPPGCKLKIAGPGAGNTALTIPSGTHILCEGHTAGFVLAGRQCSGGRYPGAACDPANADADCPGGGTCGGTAFAPSAGSTYSLFAAATGAKSVEIRGCKIWANQKDAYGRCTTGTRGGFACLHTCSVTTALACDQDADCPVGETCGNLSDCATANPTPGACTNEPGRPSGDGNITVFDLSNATDAIVQDVLIAEHIRGGTSVAVGAGNQALVERVQNALTDYTYPAHLGNTLCTAADTPYDCCTNPGAGTCGGNLIIPAPANAIPTGISATAALVQGNTVVASDDAVATTGAVMVVKNALTAPNSCVVSSGTEARIEGNTCTQTASGSGGIAIDVSGNRTQVVANTITANGDTGIKSTGQYVRIERNRVFADNSSSTVGVQAAANNSVTDNNLTVRWRGVVVTGIGTAVTGNDVQCNGDVVGAVAFYTSSSQTRFTANYTNGCYTCMENEPLAGFNFTFLGNRCFGGAGPKVVASGAGSFIAENYLAWTSFPHVVQLGHDGTTGAGTGHPVVLGNVVHSNVFKCREGARKDLTCTTDDLNATTGCPTIASCVSNGNPSACCTGSGTGPTCGTPVAPGVCGAVGIRFADVGKRCDAGSRVGLACTTDDTNATTGCPGATCPNCCDETAHATVSVTGNQFIGVRRAIDLSPLTSGGTKVLSMTIGGNTYDGFVTNPVRMPATVANAAKVSIVSNTFELPSGGEPVKSWDWDMGVLFGNQPMLPSDEQVGVPIYMANNTGGALNAGDVALVDSSADNAVKAATASATDAGGVILGNCAAGAACPVALAGATWCNVKDVTIARGDRLRVSDTVGRLDVAGSTDNAVAKALSARTSGGGSTGCPTSGVPCVRCLVQFLPAPSAVTGPPAARAAIIEPSCTYTNGPVTVLDLTASNLTGGKTAFINAVVTDIDNGNTPDDVFVKVYRQSGACPTPASSGSCQTSLPSSGAYLAPTNGFIHTNVGNGDYTTIHGLFVDTSTLSGTSHYCVIVGLVSSGTQHTVERARITLQEFQG